MARVCAGEQLIAFVLWASAFGTQTHTVFGMLFMFSVHDSQLNRICAFLYLHRDRWTLNEQTKEELQPHSHTHARACGQMQHKIGRMTKRSNSNRRWRRRRTERKQQEIKKEKIEPAHALNGSAAHVFETEWTIQSHRECNVIGQATEYARRKKRKTEAEADWAESRSLYAVIVQFWLFSEAHNVTKFIRKHLVFVGV